jgi:hypothetical protein
MFKTCLYDVDTSKETQIIYDTMQCGFCNATTSAAVRIDEYDDEDQCSRQISKVRVWKRAYLSALYIFELFSSLVQSRTLVYKSFTSDLQANARYSESSVLRSCDWQHNTAGLLTV